MLYLFYLGLAIYFVIDLVFRRHNPIKSLSWIVVLIAFPYIGLVLYMYFGRNFRKTKMYSRKGLHDERLKREISEGQVALITAESDDVNFPEALRSQKKLVLLGLNNSHSLLTQKNKAQLYFTGKDALEAMYACASQAVETIHLQSFIIENDSIGTKWKNLLVKKALEGVDVRVIYDDFGSWSLPRRYLKALRQAGVLAIPFGKVRFPGFKAMLNYRNHRKLLIVDDKVGFLGGVNIADRYYDGGDSVEWRDTHMRIEGEAVAQIQSSFLMDWYFITHKNLRSRRKKRKKGIPDPKPTKSIQADETCFMQIVSSGPDSDWADIMQLYLTIINQAKSRISLITPYFIPNESIMDALRTAALGGVDVRVLIPEKGDSPFVHAATQSYITYLLDAGIHVYMYTKGFVHSKVISIDGECCLIGSANLDNRSLEHHFEIGAMIFDTQISRQIEEKFDKDLEESHFIQKKLWNKRPLIKRIGEGLARLLSPLL